MKIKKVQLNNGYKRFKNLTIDLGENPKRFIVLVGPNGSGKSSVLDGLMYILNSHLNTGNKGDKGYKYHSMMGLPSYNYQNVSVEFTDGTFSAVYSRKMVTGEAATIFSLRSPYRYNSNLNVDSTIAMPAITLNGYGATSLCDLDDKMEQSYRRLYIKYNEYLNAQDCTPSAAKAKIIGDLNKSLGNCLNIELVSLGSIEASRGTLFFKKPDHPAEFEFNVLSSGEKEVVDILLDLYLRADAYSDTVFLIDEPELHINSAIQRKLLLEIDKLVGPACQIWIATHSIGFLRAVQEDLSESSQILHFTEDLNLASTDHTLFPVRMTSARWRELFSIALDDLTHLISPRTIIYCEGRDAPGKQGQERGFDAKVLNTVFTEKYPDILFVSSGGNTELDQRSQIAIAILSKALPNVEILVLKDRDMSSGFLNSNKERELYLENNPKNHRVLKRWEIENYLFDREVLENYCTAKSLNFDGASYDDFITDIYNQNVKDDWNRVKGICGIKTSVNAENFKLNLAAYVTQETAVFSELEDCVFQ